MIFFSLIFSLSCARSKTKIIWLCAWDVCYIIFCHLLHIRSGKTGKLFSLLLCSLRWVHIVGYALPCRSYSFVCTAQHLIIIIVQTYLKTLNLSDICQIYTICGLCVFSLPISLVMIERIDILCLIIIIKSEVWTITHCLGSGHETIVCTVCLSIFLWKLVGPHAKYSVKPNMATIAILWQFYYAAIVILHQNRYGSHYEIMPEQVWQPLRNAKSLKKISS